MGFLTLLVLWFLLIGTYLLSSGIFSWDGGLFVLLALMTFILLILERDGGDHRLEGWLQAVIPRIKRRRGVMALRAGAFLASFGVAMDARHRSSALGFAFPFVIWLAAIATFIGSLLFAEGAGGVQGAWHAAIRRLRSAWLRGLNLIAPWERWAIGGLLIVAGLLRCVNLEHIPANLGGDEGTQLTAALALVGEGPAPGRMGNPFATGWYSVPTMSFAVYGLAMRLFGATVAGGRALSAVVGTLTVGATYVLGRLVGGRRTGWAAAIFLAFSAYHIHYSRLASNQIFDPFIGTLAMTLLWYALQSRYALHSVAAMSAWGLVGIVAGLGWYAYFGARWVSFLIVLVVIVAFLADRSLIRRHWCGLLLCALGWLIVVLPLLGWYTVHPSSLSERYRAVSIFASGWLTREVAITGRPAFQIMAQQVWRAVSAFHVTPDPTFWYRPERPLVDFVTGALLLLGVVDAAMRLAWPSRRLVNLWFWSTLVMAWVITENPPSSQRGLLLAPAVAVFAAWGLERIGSLFRLSARGYRLVVAAVLLAVAVLNISFYFTVYTPQRIYGNPTAQRATELARYMLAHPEPVCYADPALACSGRAYLLGPPWFYWDFGTLSFMVRRFPGESVLPDAKVGDVTGPARFIVVPERIAEMAALQQRYPGGTETALYGADSVLLLIVYDWPGAAAP